MLTRLFTESTKSVFISTLKLPPAHTSLVELIVLALTLSEAKKFVALTVPLKKFLVADE